MGVVKLCTPRSKLNPEGYSCFNVSCLRIEFILTFNSNITIVYL